MLLDTTGKSNLLANVGASRGREDELSSVVLVGGDLGTGGSRTDVYHDDLVLRQLGDLGLLSVGGSDTEEAAEEVEVDFDLAVDLGEAALETEDVTDETVGSAEGRIDTRTDADETSGDGVLEIVGFGVEGDDAAEDGLALEGALLVAGDDAGADLDLVAELEDTVEDTATGDTALELVDLGTGLVDVEGSDDDHVRVKGEVSRGDGDGVDDGVENGVDVELELGRNGDDGRLAGYCTPNELED